MFRSTSDAPLLWLVRAAALVVCAVLALIVLFVLRESWPALERIGVPRFFTDTGWYPTEGRVNLAPMLAASLAVAAGAVLFALPLALGVALFLRYFAPRALAAPVYWVVVLSAGIPSVVLGLWGLTVVVPLIGAAAPPGTSLLAGALVLALMIVPTIALTADAALGAVPKSYADGAMALGLTREAALLRIVLPAARGGIMAGVLLAFARALGETMVVLMVTGNVVRMPDGLFSPVRTLTANIGLEMAYALDFHRSALFVSGLALTALVLVLSLLATRLGGSRFHA